MQYEQRSRKTGRKDRVIKGGTVYAHIILYLFPLIRLAQGKARGESIVWRMRTKN